MQFSFNIRSLFKDPITIWDSDSILHLDKKDALPKFTNVVDKMGFYSAKVTYLFR
jgi:hypothetical protein